jgi:phosphatidylinositol-3-phosphatase
MSSRSRILSLLLVFLALTSISFAQVPRSKHVYILAEENRSYEHIVGSSDMPYLNGLLKQYGLASEFYSTQHSSFPNYFWVTAGISGAPFTDDDETTALYNGDNLVRRLQQAGLSYKSYAQSLPNPGFQGVYSGAYMKRHAPLPYFTDMAGNPNEIVKHVDTNHWLADIASGSLPNFAFITPDGDHDMHNCDTVSLSVCLQTADQFLRDHLVPLLERPEFQPGGDGLLILWADEADLDGIDDRCSATVKTGCGGHIVVALIGPNVKQGYRSTTTYHHEDLLRTMMEALGLPGPYLGKADSASEMAEFFVQTAGTAGTPDFAISPAPGFSQSITIAPGQAAGYKLMASPMSGFSGPLAFSCSGLPVGAACNFSPASVTLGGIPANVALSIATTPHTSSHVPALPLGYLGTTFAALCLFVPTGFRRNMRWGGLSVLALALSISFITGCGGGGKDTASTSTLNFAASQAGPTPSGTYTVTVLATSSSGQTRSSTLKLTVQ